MEISAATDGQVNKAIRLADKTRKERERKKTDHLDFYNGPNPQFERNANVLWMWNWTWRDEGTNVREHDTFKSLTYLKSCCLGNWFAIIVHRAPDLMK